MMMIFVYVFVFFFQAEDGIRDLVRSRGLGDVYKRQGYLDEVNSKADILQVKLFTMQGKLISSFQTNEKLSLIHI